MAKSIFNIKIIDTLPDKLLRLCVERLINKEKTFIITLNSLMILRYFFNQEFREAIKKADLIFVDGYGIILASRWLKHEIKNHIPGIDFMYQLLGSAYENKFSVFLFGSQWEVVNKAFLNLKKWFTPAKFLGKYSGYYNQDEELKIIEGINKVSPDILFVGMGSPKQEIWIAKNLEKLNVRLMIGMGGSFDVIAGYKQRAPERWRKKNLEWLYRSITSPSKFFNLFKIAIYLFFVLYYKVFLLRKEK